MTNEALEAKGAETLTSAGMPPPHAEAVVKTVTDMTAHLATADEMNRRFDETDRRIEDLGNTVSSLGNTVSSLGESVNILREAVNDLRETQRSNHESMVQRIEGLRGTLVKEMISSLARLLTIAGIVTAFLAAIIAAVFALIFAQAGTFLQLLGLA